MEDAGGRQGEKTHAALLARGKALMATEPNYARFLIYATRATDPDDFAPYDAALMDAEFRRSFVLLERRGAAPQFISFTPSDVLQLDAPEIIDIFTPDMPFTVDSVLAAIRAKGGVVRLVSHPVLPVDPDSHRVLNEPVAQSRQESFLHIHIDPLPDEVSRSALRAEISGVLDEVALAVGGWRPMLERLRQVVHEFRDNPTPIEAGLLSESVQFLGWLADHNFTFLGLREYRLTGDPQNPVLEPVAGSGIGLLVNPAVKILRLGTQLVEMTPEHLDFLAGPEALMVAKANLRTRVHRRGYMDYVGVKVFDAAGRLIGEVRIVGLFTSQALAAPNGAVPIVRRKVALVQQRSGLPPRGHAGKALQQALDTYPRDETFQIADDELFEFATIIASLNDRPRVRVLPRVDRFNNFVSILFYMPRNRYDEVLRVRIGAYLAQRFEGRVSAYYPHFPEGELVRVHFIIGRDGAPTPRPAREDLERDIAAMTRNYGDEVLEAAANTGAVEPWRMAFPPAYQAVFAPAQALLDATLFDGLGPEVAIHLAPGRRPEAPLLLKFYHRASPIPLSARVPLLENFGFGVIDEETFVLTPAGGGEAFLHEMEISLSADAPALDSLGTARLEEALLAVWRGEAENDSLNALTLRAGLASDDVAILRALSRYLRQLGFPASQPYIAATLNRHANAAAALVALFHARLDPKATDPGAAATAAEADIAAALEATEALDEDRIIRRFHDLIEAALRSNFYQRRPDGGRRPALGIKFDCAAIPEMPEPKPWREIFVYAPRFEGSHLRFGPVARGGIRWSDRPEDFRTEILDLAKTQQVKNAIIVPVGAKGGFVPKALPPGGDRDAIIREGLTCYRLFIGTLLDVTDNIVDGTITHPADTLCRDDNDPYLVVAADKGTSDFSDTANAIAGERGFWLGDAFASGGSAGYDHKRMGITARGAWEGVKRHFREMGRDIQNQPFTVVGIGDMSGDVFGNGMLLSPQTRLIAAFDHRDIFIDPSPDAATSLAERQRLFNLSRSSWQDFDRALLSPGGGVYSRSLKSIDPSPEARAALGVPDGPLPPQKLVRAILSAGVDLLWFGGIGTYVRATGETDAQVGDKQNDAVRVTGAELRASVVGEGANLAMTQRGRIEYALRGGRLNSDAIDNSAGVNASDLEVNVKIALGSLQGPRRLSVEARNEFLTSLTPQVAELCLRNNQQQTLALSLAARSGVAALPEHRSLLASLETHGLISRSVEALPDDAALTNRTLAGRGFTRPELAVLLAYAKNTLEDDLVASHVPDDPYLAQDLFSYFPERLAEVYGETIATHRLRREIIATVLANAMLNRGGPGYVVAMMDASSADVSAVTTAYAAARDAFGLNELYRYADYLDGRVPGDAQLALYAEIRALLRRTTLWFLRNESFAEGLSAFVARYRQGIAEVRGAFATLLPKPMAASVEMRAQAFAAPGIPAELARRFAELQPLALAADVVLVAGRAGSPVPEAARALFAVMEDFGLGRIVESAERITLADRFDRMALDRALANVLRAQRDLAIDVLTTGAGTIGDRLAAWRRGNAGSIARVARAVAELTESELTVSRLSVAAGLLSDLAQGS